jgi:hypothetical protein
VRGGLAGVAERAPDVNQVALQVAVERVEVNILIIGLSSPERRLVGVAAVAGPRVVARDRVPIAGLLGWRRFGSGGGGVGQGRGGASDLSSRALSNSRRRYCQLLSASVYPPSSQRPAAGSTSAMSQSTRKTAYV